MRVRRVHKSDNIVRFQMIDGEVGKNLWQTSIIEKKPIDEEE